MSGEPLAFSFEDLGRLACYLEDTHGCAKALHGTICWVTIHSNNQQEAEAAGAKVMEGYEDA